MMHPHVCLTVHGRREDLRGVLKCRRVWGVVDWARRAWSGHGMNQDGIRIAQQRHALSGQRVGGRASVAGPAESRWGGGGRGGEGRGSCGFPLGGGGHGRWRLAVWAVGRRASVYRFLCYYLNEDHWDIDTCYTQ